MDGITTVVPRASVSKTPMTFDKSQQLDLPPASNATRGPLATVTTMSDIIMDILDSFRYMQYV